MSGPSIDVTRRQMPSGLVLPLPSPLLASLPPQYQDKPYQWFAQVIDILALVTGVAQSGAFTTDNMHAFAGWYGTASVRNNATKAALTGEALSLTLTDNANNNYTPANAAIELDNVFGTARQPAIFPEPLIIDKNGTFTTRVTQAGATTVDVHFGFIGVLIDLR